MGVGDLVGCLLEEDAGAGVGEKAGGDLLRGGAVGGLGPEVGQLVADEDVADPPMPAELEPGLEVLDRPLVLEQRPHLVVDLEPASLAAKRSHGGLQPGRCRHHHERERFTVLEHGGEVDDDAEAVVPVDVDGGGSVEHAAQGAVEELAEPERNRHCRCPQLDLGEPHRVRGERAARRAVPR